MPFRKKIITINSPKGGVGKSSFLRQLSYELAKNRFLNGQLKILLIDLDLEFGDVCSLFQVNPNTNISNWVAEIQYKLNEGQTDIHYTEMEAKRRFITSVPELGLDILPAPLKHTEYYDIEPRTIDIILNNIKSYNYDIILIDTGNNTYDYTIRSIMQSDIVYLMLTLDITTIKRAYNLLDLLKEIKCSIDHFKYIVNFCDLSKDNDFYEIEEILEHSIDYKLPYDDDVRKNSNEGTFMGKKTEYFKAVEKIMEDILQN